MMDSLTGRLVISLLISDCCLMRLDKWTVVIGGATIAVTIILGWLAGALPGVLTALAGAAFSVGWQVAVDRRSRLRETRDKLGGAARELAPPHRAATSPAGYLRPEAEIVAFRHRPELDVLCDWLAGPANSGVLLVTGQAGTGKTRLALHFAGIAQRQYGWRCYWVPSGDERQAAETVRQGGGPALLIIDYAETRSDLAALIASAGADDTAPPSRVLLLARSAGEWWQQLITESGSPASDMLAGVVPVTLGVLTGPVGQEQVFRDALAAFAAELQAACPDLPAPPLEPGAVVLVVHAAALLAVLDRQGPVAGPAVYTATSSSDVIDHLLRHEARYWQHTQARYQLNLGPAVRDRAVAVGTLIGAGDETSALRLLAVIEDLADPATRSKTARWLHDLYPAGPDLAYGEWIGPLRPDLVAERHIVRVLAGQPDLARAIFSGLAGHGAGRALTTLARAAHTQPAALGLIQTVLHADPGGLIVPAMSVAVETNRAVADQIAAVLQAGLPGPNVFRQITRELPETSVALAEIAVIAYQHLADAPGDAEQRAPNLVNLSNWLARLGRHEDALVSVEQAVAAYRELAAAEPGAFLPNLAMALNNQSGRLAVLGRREDALASVEQAVAAYRELAAAEPGAFLPNLAMALNNQSGRLAVLGRREDALASVEQAVAAYRELAAAEPGAFLSDLAATLNNQSNCLAVLGRREDALASVEQAVTVYRELAAARPDAFLPDLATVLYNQSGRLAVLRQLEDALTAIDQAVAIRRELAAVRPDAFLPNLAMALNNQSGRLVELGRREDALAAIDQAVAAYRKLAAARPDAFLPDLATALYNQSGRLADLGRLEDALATAEQAVAAYRKLADARPAAFKARLKSSLTLLADALAAVGRNSDADTARTEAAWPD
jgi:tetratricopeptide (TPR) repeat protein